MKSKSILLIEDNNDIRENLTELLEMSGYKVVGAANGKIGVQLAKKNKPDIIVCDIMMPELDGYGVLNILATDSTTANIPFIFLTAKTESTDIRKGMNMGADDYIIKPFEDAELLKAIEVRLEKVSKLTAPTNPSIEQIEKYINNVASLDDLIKLSKERKRIPFKKKQTIYSSGSNARGVYFIESGIVKTYLTSDNDKDYILNVYNAGDFFGYNNLLDSDTYHENAETTEDSILYFIPRHDFEEMILKNRLIAHEFIKMLAGDVQSQQERMVKLAYNSVRKRVAESILALGNKLNPEGLPNHIIQASRQDLANMVGTATESVIRTLSDFKDEKLIELHGSQLVILNKQKLENMRN
jgi:CheY-like chemotaxis protein/CRP-like cAMP-binding protein